MFNHFKSHNDRLGKDKRSQKTQKTRFITLALGRFDLVMKLIHGNIVVRIGAKPLTSTLVLRCKQETGRNAFTQSEG